MKIYQTSQELISVFQCEKFSKKELILNLFLNLKEPGAHDFLVQKLEYLSDRKFEFYLPQLVFMACKVNVPKLQKFLTNKAFQIQFYFLISQYLSAYSEMDRKDPTINNQIEQFLALLETNLVNGVTSQIQLKEAYNTLDDQSFKICKRYFFFLIQYQVQVEVFLQKANLSEYIQENQRFIRNLIKLSLKLKSIEQSKRNNYLNECIEKANKTIKKNRQMKNEVKLFHGIHIPFQTKKQDHHQSNMIVSIIENDYTCFNTKMRVPYRIILETISLEDLQKFPIVKPQSSVKSLSQLDTDDEFVDMKQNDDEIEHIMRQIAQSKILFDYDLSLLKRLAVVTLKRGSLQQIDIPNIQQINSDRKMSIQIVQKKKEISSIFEKFKKKGNQDKFDIIFPKQKIQRRNSESSQNFKAYCIFEQSIERPQIIQRNLSLVESQELTMVEKSSSSQASTNINNYEFVENTSYFEVPTEPDCFGPWEEIWEDKVEIIRNSSMYGHFPSYKLRQVIVKGGDDLRYELLAMQIITRISKILKKEGTQIYLRPYEIIVTSPNSGIIGLEFIPNTLSIDSLKKKTLNFKSLEQFYKETFKRDFEIAQKNFVQSLAGYSLIQYLLQVKDRHNGNILIDNQGHIIHVDFGFVFGMSPGNMNFETSPFKLTKEYIDLMDQDLFMYFQSLLFQGFIILRKHIDEISMLIRIFMELDRNKDMICFNDFNINEFKNRFMLGITEGAVFESVQNLIKQSSENWSTTQYDKFQYMTNKILP